MWYNPISLSDDTNGWLTPAGGFLNPSTKILMPKFNPVASPNIGLWDTYAWQGTTSRQWLITPTVANSDPSQAWFDPYANTNSDNNPINSIAYNTLAPAEWFLNKAQDFTKDYSQGLQSVWSDIQSGINKAGNYLQWQNPNIDEMKAKNEYHTQDNLKNYILSKNIPRDQAETLVNSLINSWHIIQWINEAPQSWLQQFVSWIPWMDIAWGLVKTGWQLLGWFAWGLGSTMEWVQNMTENANNDPRWDINKWLSRATKGAWDLSTGIISALYAPISTLLNTKTVQDSFAGKSMEWVGNHVWSIVDSWLQEAGIDKNSPQYADYHQGLTTLAMNYIVTPLINKWGLKVVNKTFWENIDFNNITIKDFEAQWANMNLFYRSLNVNRIWNITSKTKLSDILTPEQSSYLKDYLESRFWTSTVRREGLISPLINFFSKWAWFMSNRMNSDPNTQQDNTVNSSGENAVNSQGIRWTVTEPTTLTNIKDKVFWDSNNIDLANRAVSPRNVKGKTMTDKMKSGEVALAGIQQLHDDSIAENISADIGTIEWGIAGIEEARQHYGKIIGENANPNEKIQASDIGKTLQTDLQNPIMVISWPIKGIGDDLVKMLNHPSFKDGITMKDVQTTLSTVSNRIRNSPELRNSLKSEPAWQAVSTFIDELSRRYEKAVEEGWNWSADKQARQAYTKYMKIQNDLLNSGMVNSRNSRTGQAGFVGKSIATYELLSHGLSGIPVALAMKYLGETKWEYATRGGAYEKLIRNMNRNALQRTKWAYNTGDTSQYTSKPTPKTTKPTPKPKANASSTVNNSSIPTNNVDLAWSKVNRT